MGAKAPTPAPNRRADGTVDPSYKQPFAPPTPTPTLPTREDFENAVALLETLTSDITITRLGEGIEANSRHPRDLHIYTCFLILDADPTCDIFTKHLEPAMRKMAAALSDIPAIAVQQLASPRDVSVRCYNFPDSVLPLRCITHYDGVEEGYRVTLDLYCRPIEPEWLIYFLRKKGTDQYYQRRGGRKHHCGEKRGTCDPKWGSMTTAACWTTPNGPRPVKGSDGEIVMFRLGEEFVT